MRISNRSTPGSIDGSFAPLRVMTDFYQVLNARNRLIAMQYALRGVSDRPAGERPQHARRFASSLLLEKATNKINHLKIFRSGPS